jgi:hypothetical protein
VAWGAKWKHGAEIGKQGNNLLFRRTVDCALRTAMDQKISFVSGLCSPLGYICTSGSPVGAVSTHWVSMQSANFCG